MSLRQSDADELQAKASQHDFDEARLQRGSPEASITGLHSWWRVAHRTAIEAGE